VVKNCTICKGEYKVVYREWYDNLVPNVCSGSCYADWLARELRNHPAIPGEPYPRELVNKDRRSSYENVFEDWLVVNNISYRYEPYSFYIGNKMYVPDFLINLGTYVEVKGLWNAGDKTKVKGFREHLGLHLHVIDLPFLRGLKHERVRDDKKFVI